MASDDIVLRTAATPFPPGFCPPSQQAFADAIAASLEVFLPNSFLFAITGPSQPTVEQRDRLWVKTDPSTGLVVGFYTWLTVIGQWGRNHWLSGVVPTNERRLWIGSEASLETYEGGEPGTVSLSTGPFWMRDTAFNDKWPIGVGAVIAAPLSTLSIFDDATPGTPDGIGVFVIKPTGRSIDIAT